MSSEHPHSRRSASAIIDRAMIWAHRRDLQRLASPKPGRTKVATGALAQSWAAAKFAALAATFPVWVPTVLIGAAFNHRRAKRDILGFPAAIQAIAERRPTHLDADVVLERPSTERIIIFSDLHRCIPGRLDWPTRQGTKELYAEVLDRYAEDEWTLLENGDVEDFWMVGGSALGAVYDAARLFGCAVSRRDPEVLPAMYRSYLDRILDNNSGVYATIRERFAAHGRYLRTIGNHDDPLRDPSVAARLAERIGPFPIGDFVSLRSSNDPDGLECVIAHGHHTDGWNAPKRDALGKFSTWFGNTIVDVPGLSIPEGLPPADAAQHLFDRGPADHLVELHPLIGATTDYDSLDEELLFAAMRNAGLDDHWLVLGHTHLPVDGPHSKGGTAWKGYVNGGSGIGNGFVTGIEWDGSSDTPRPVLVVWTMADGELRRTELHGTGNRSVAVSNPSSASGDMNH